MAQQVDNSKVKTYSDLTDASGAAISADKCYLMALPGRSNTALAYYTSSYNKIYCANNQYAANKAYPASYAYHLESANSGSNVIIKNLGKSVDNYFHIASGDYGDGKGKVTVDGTSENAEKWQIYKGVETANRFHFITTGASGDTQRTLSNNGGLGNNLGFWSGNGSDRFTDTGGQFSFIEIQPITISVEDLQGNTYPFTVNGTEFAAGVHTIYVENFDNFTITCDGTPSKYVVNDQEQTEVPTWSSGMTVKAVLGRVIFDASKVVAKSVTKITDEASIDQNKAYILKNTGRNYYMGLNNTNKGVGKQYHKHTSSTSNLMWYILPQSDGTYKLQSVYNQQYIPALSWNSQFTTVADAENGDNFTIKVKDGKFAFVSTATHTDSKNIYLDGNDWNPVGWSADGDPNGNNAYEIYEVETGNYDMPAIPVTSGNYYMLKVKNNWVGFNGETGSNGGTLNTPVITPADDMQGFYWKFEGNNEDGWTLTNKGTGKTYHTTEDKATLPEGDGKWIIEYNPVTNVGWRLVAKDTEETYLNLRGTVLGTWKNGSAVTNDGCVIVFQESTPIEFDDTKAYYMYSDVRGSRRWIDLSQNGRTNANLYGSQKLTFEVNSDNSAYYIKDAAGNYVKQLTQGQIPGTTTSQAEAGVFTLRPYANGLAIGKKGDANNVNTGWHLDGSNNLVGWECNADANKWQLVSLTVPERGHFYTFKGVANENHMTSLLDANNKVIVNSTATGKDIIWYVAEDGKLIAYANGMVPWIGQNTACGLKMTTESGITAATYQYYGPNQLLVMMNGRYAYNANATLDSGSGYGGDQYPGYKWIAEEVEELPITIATSGYTTLYSPVALTLPEDGSVKAYTADLNESKATVVYHGVEQIPANKGVLLRGTPGEHSLTVAAEPIEIENETSLIGKAFTQAYDKEANTVGGESLGERYVYTLQSGTFKYYTGTKLTGFKAHYELQDGRDSAAGVRQYTFSFGEDDDATGIAEIEGMVNKDANIYDITGRRVSANAKGLLIINGKKVIK